MTITWVRTQREPTPAPRDSVASIFHGDAMEATWCNLQQRRFAALQGAFTRHGGCASADEVCCLLRAHWDQPLSRLARWITRRDIVSVTWRAQVWIPLFQFERPSLDLVPAVSDVICALRQVYDEWELAEWLVRPHDLLTGCIPASRLGCDPGAVTEAARRDQFINRW